MPHQLRTQSGPNCVLSVLLALPTSILYHLCFLISHPHPRTKMRQGPSSFYCTGFNSPIIKFGSMPPLPLRFRLTYHLSILSGGVLEAHRNGWELVCGRKLNGLESIFLNLSERQSIVQPSWLSDPWVQQLPCIQRQLLDILAYRFFCSLV